MRKSIRNIFIIGLCLTVAFLCSGCKDKKQKSAKTVSPEGFVKKFIFAENTPNAKYCEASSLLGGEEFCKMAAKAQKLDISEYYSKLTRGEAKDYNGYIDYQNSYRKSYLISKFGADKLNTHIDSVKSEKLENKVIKDIQNLLKDYSFIDRDKIKNPYKVTVEYTMTGAESTESYTKYFLLVEYKGELKNFADTDSNEEFEQFIS